MIFIQIFLVAAVVYVLARFLSDRNTQRIKAWKKIALGLLALGAVIAIIFPELANITANTMGVGRGADLLLYILAIAFIFQELSSYIKSKDEHKRMVKLARKVAIIEAQNRKSNNQQ